jgi:hypothetical protein
METSRKIQHMPPVSSWGVQKQFLAMLRFEQHGKIEDPPGELVRGRDAFV